MSNYQHHWTWNGKEVYTLDFINQWKPVQADHYLSHQKSSTLNPSLGKTPHVSAIVITFPNKCPGKDGGKRGSDFRVSTTLDLRSVLSWVLVSHNRWRKSHWKGNIKNDGRRPRTGMFYLSVNDRSD